MPKNNDYKLAYNIFSMSHSVVNKYLYILLFIVIATSCKNKKLKSEDRSSEDKGASTEMFYLISKDTGFLFGEHMETSKDLKSTVIWTRIYKTVNGAKKFTLIDSALNESYVDKKPVFFKNSFYYTINSIIDLRPRGDFLVMFDMENYKKRYFPRRFGVLRKVSEVGGYLYFIARELNDNNWWLYRTDRFFNQLDSFEVDKSVTVRSEIVDINNQPYCITWENKLYNLLSKQAIDLPDEIVFEQIFSDGNGKCSILGTNEKHGKKVIVAQYDFRTKQLLTKKKVHGYSIINNLRSSGNIRVATIGNIEGIFVSYDILYSLDAGETWKVYEPESQQFCRLGNICDSLLYIDQCINTFDVIHFK